MSSVPLARLLQLASAALPVGAYSYSQGLEWAVGCGAVADEQSAHDWIEVVLEHGVATWDAPSVAALMRACDAGDEARISALNERCLASRETRELLAETVQTGNALLGLLRDSGDLPQRILCVLERLGACDGIAYPTAWAAAASARGIPLEDALVAYLWSWLENAVLAAIKAIPLGQRAGQRLLTRLGARLAGLAADAAACPPEHCRNLLPGFALASMHHETQYTRLFRS